MIPEYSCWEALLKMLTEVEPMKSDLGQVMKEYGEYTLAKNLLTSPYRPEYVLSHAFDSYPTGARPHYSLTVASQSSRIS